MRRCRAINKFVNTFVSVDAVLQDMDHGFVAKQRAAFGVRNVSAFVEENSIRLSRVDVQSAGLVRMAEHLHDAGQVVVRQVAAQASVRLSEHLRGLETFYFANDDLFHVGGDDAGLAASVDVIVASGLKRFHKRALAAVAESNDGKIGILGVRANDASDFQRPHFAHVRGAENGARRVIFEGRQGISRLRAGRHFKTFALQRVAKSLGEIHVAVNQQNLDGARGRDHGLPSAPPGWARPAPSWLVVAECAKRSLGPGVNASRLRTSMTSPPCESHPATCGSSDALAGVNSALINSHSPVTGRATHSVLWP